MSTTIFSDPLHFSVFSPAISTVICALNQGRTGKLGAVAVHASSKGYRITFDGRTLARGSTPGELAANFKKRVDKVCKVES